MPKRPEMDKKMKDMPSIVVAAVRKCRYPLPQDVKSLVCFLKALSLCFKQRRLNELPIWADGLPDDNSKLVPPDPISNSVVKRFSADGSVGDPM